MKEEILQTLTSYLIEKDFVTPEQVVKPETHFKNDLGLDSLEVVEIIMDLEQHYDISDTSVEIPETVGELIVMLEQNIKASPKEIQKRIGMGECNKVITEIRQDITKFASSNDETLIIIVKKDDWRLSRKTPTVDSDTLKKLLS